MKGAKHDWGGGGSNSANLPGLPVHQVTLPVIPEYGLEIDAGSILAADSKLVGSSYEIWTKGDTPQLLAKGSLDNLGRSSLANSPAASTVEIVVGENEWLDIEDIQAEGEQA